MGRIDVDLQQRLQILGRRPVAAHTAQVGGPPRIAEPDPARGLQLLEEGAAIGGEDEGEYKRVAAAVGPGATDRHGLALEAKAAGVALGLVDRRRDVLIAPLGLDDPDALRADEEGVVGHAVAGGPLGNGEVAALHWAGADAVAQLQRVGLPAACAQLGVNQGARGRLVDVEQLGGRLALGDQGERGGSRGLGGDELEGLELVGKRGLGLLGLGGELLPDRAILVLLMGALLGAELREGGVLRGAAGPLGLGARLVEHALQPVKLDLKQRRGVGGVRGRGEGAGRKARVVEGAVKPDTKLAGELEHRERIGVVA